MGVMVSGNSQGEGGLKCNLEFPEWLNKAQTKNPPWKEHQYFLKYSNLSPMEYQRHDIFTNENNMLPSHVKISPLLWLRNKSCLLQLKKYSEMIWYFIGCYLII